MKAKCIKLEEKTYRYWSHDFTIGKIYEIAGPIIDDDSLNLLHLIGDRKNAWHVDKDCFELVRDMDNEMFKKLSPVEAFEYRKWARENYKPGDCISELWHPVVRQECEMMNVEQVQCRIE